jgi:hypothetical protein
MTNLSDLQLEQAFYSELVMVVRLLLARVEPLEKEVQMLREGNETLKRPKPNSRNSSQLPSRDQKPNFKLSVQSGVPLTNNASEQAIRTSVIHRKVTNGFRSEWGGEGLCGPALCDFNFKDQG